MSKPVKLNKTETKLLELVRKNRGRYSFEAIRYWPGYRTGRDSYGKSYTEKIRLRDAAKSLAEKGLVELTRFKSFQGKTWVGNGCWAHSVHWAVRVEEVAS